jgi:magnesium transporter
MQIYILNAQGGLKIEETADVAALIKESETIFWVDMVGPTTEDIRVMRDVFKFHPLAIEDSTNQRQRPKVEEYGDILFTIVNTVVLEAMELDFRELDVFVGPHYIVTVHEKNEPVIERVVSRCKHRLEYGQQITIGFLAYAIVDTVVDSYFPVLDTIGDEIENMNESILDRPRKETLERLFRLKRMLAEMWRVAGQQRDMFNVLSRENSHLIQEESLRYYLRDVYDHLLRISDTVNTFRDMLSNVVDLYMSAVSNRLNVVVQRLTVLTVGVGILTVISGFYGMNFVQTWPPFTADWGVRFVLALMVLTVIVILFVLWWLER